MTASDGQEALEMYREALGSRPFDAVVLDLVVPKGMGGAETMERLLDFGPQGQGRGLAAGIPRTP